MSKTLTLRKPGVFIPIEDAERLKIALLTGGFSVREHAIQEVVEWLAKAK